jgi:hypothetical protein
MDKVSRRTQLRLSESEALQKGDPVLSSLAAKRQQVLHQQLQRAVA